MNIDKILDNVLYTMMILSGLLCLVASGKDIAKTITEISAGEYSIALYDAVWAILLFEMGFTNIKAAWKYWAMGITRGLISFQYPTFSSTPMGNSCGI